MVNQRALGRLIGAARRVLLLFLAWALALPLVLGGLGGSTAVVEAATLPAGFYEETITTATAYQTTTFAFVPDGRILIAEKQGLVRIYKDGALLPTPLLDIQDRVNQKEDRGLIGLAVDPDFANGSPFIYLAYTYERGGTDPQSADPRTGRISKFRVTGDTAGPEQIILGTVTPPSQTCNNVTLGEDCIASDGKSHSVGNLKFAPDGTLFATLGDGAAYEQVELDALRAQRVDWLAGKVLRITKDGKGLASNPFSNGDVDANRSKVWAMGVRNAFRFTLRPGTDIPYVGDVGWGRWEEVNVATRGANLGWPCYEGDGQQDSYAVLDECKELYAEVAAGRAAVKPPLHAYAHAGTTPSGSVVGGAFYTGTSYPTEYRGAFFFGDYSNDFIKYLKVDANQNLVGGINSFATGLGGPVAIESGPDGDLYYLSILTGELRRIRYGTPPPPPLVTTGPLSDNWVSATNGYGPVEVNTSNGNDGKGDGGPITIGGTEYTTGLGMHANADVRYALGTGCDYFTAKIGIDDGVGDSGSVIYRVYGDSATPLYETEEIVRGTDAAKSIIVSMRGQSTLRLVVDSTEDGTQLDHADWAEARCNANQPPVVQIAQPLNDARYTLGEQIAYSGSATDPEGQAVTLSWQLITQHCPGGSCHAHPSQLGSAGSGTFLTTDHDDETHLELLLTATDADGQKSTASVSLYPWQASLNLSASPAGLNVVYGGKPAAPTITQAIDIGGTRTVSAPSPQTLNGTTYVFSRWSDGNTNPQRPIVMGAGGLTLTAIFEMTTTPSPTPSPMPTPSPTPSPSAIPSPSPGALAFADVAADYWAGPEIAQFAARKITTGCGDDEQGRRLYCPERGVTRAEMAVFITRTLGQDQVPATRQSFADVPTDYWAYAQIEAFAELGITTGCGTNELGQRIFCPDRGVTRAEMAAFIDRAKGQGELADGRQTFADVPVTYWAYGWIERFFALALTTGCGEDDQGRRLYCPDRGVTRAEMAVFIIRAYP